MLLDILWCIAKLVVLASETILHVKWAKSEEPLNEIIQAMPMGNLN